MIGSFRKARERRKAQLKAQAQASSPPAVDAKAADKADKTEARKGPSPAPRR